MNFEFSESRTSEIHIVHQAAAAFPNVAIAFVNVVKFLPYDPAQRERDSKGNSKGSRYHQSGWDEEVQRSLDPRGVGAACQEDRMLGARVIRFLNSEDESRE